MSDKRKRRPRSAHGPRQKAQDVKTDPVSEVSNSPEGGISGSTENGAADTHVSMLELKVTNLADAKLEFFASGCSVAPTFTYGNDVSKITDLVLRNHNVNFSLLHEAKIIMSKGREAFGNLTSFQEHCYGTETLSDTVLCDKVRTYLRKHNIEQLVDVNIDDAMLAVANVTQPSQDGKYLVNVCAAQATRGMVQSICDHEIGTHLLRIMNDEKQPWHKKRNYYRLADSSSMYSTEEGLATLNTIRTLPSKSLQFYAVRYYAVCYGAKLGFVDLFNDLRAYDIDSDTCWQICCRIKRGLVDTSMPGAFWKDQSYLQGAVEILQHLETVASNQDRANLFMKHLYSGRIAVSDLKLIRCVVDNRDGSILMPHFLSTAKNLKAWLKHCRDIIKENALADICNSKIHAPRSESAPPRAVANENIPANGESGSVEETSGTANCAGESVVGPFVEEDKHEHPNNFVEQTCVQSARENLSQSQSDIGANFETRNPTRASVRRQSIEHDPIPPSLAEVSVPVRISRHTAPEDEEVLTNAPGFFGSVCLGTIDFKGAHSDTKPEVDEGVIRNISSQPPPKERRRSRSASRRASHQYHRSYSKKHDSNNVTAKIVQTSAQASAGKRREVVDIWDFIEEDPISIRKDPVLESKHRRRQWKIRTALRAIFVPFRQKRADKLEGRPSCSQYAEDSSDLVATARNKRSRSHCACVVC